MPSLNFHLCSNTAFSRLPYATLVLSNIYVKPLVWVNILLCSSKVSVEKNAYSSRPTKSRNFENLRLCRALDDQRLRTTQQVWVRESKTCAFPTPIDHLSKFYILLKNILRTSTVGSCIPTYMIMCNSTQDAEITYPNRKL